MSNDPAGGIPRQSVELDGVRYVILRESVFDALCRQAGVPSADVPPDKAASSSGLDMDQPALAQKLVARRRSAGLSQAELARRAGVRPETLNRIERGRTTPDFATIRKLVVAMNDAERHCAALSIPTSANNTNKENENVVAK